MTFFFVDKIECLRIFQAIIDILEGKEVGSFRVESEYCPRGRNISDSIQENSLSRHTNL